MALDDLPLRDDPFMIVELVGPPGSGKTAVAQAIIERLRAAGIDAVGFDELEDYRTRLGDRRLNRMNAVQRWLKLAPLRRRFPGLTAKLLRLVWDHRALTRKRWRKAKTLTVDPSELGEVSRRGASASSK